MSTRRYLAAFAFGITLAATAALLTAGPLDPPAGPIAPTYKTLSEVEPRVAINSNNTRGDPNSTYRIAQPGSYYLTGNVAGETGKHGIEIAASNVTIDLMGYAVNGVPGSLCGIATDGLQGNLTIRNGSVSHFGEAGIDLTKGGIGVGSLVESVHAASNAAGGILGNARSVIRGCSADANTMIGISARVTSSFDRCSITNTNGVGLFTFENSTVTSTVSSYNSDDGFYLGIGAIVSASSAAYNGGNGFNAFFSANISNCSANQNVEAGIVAGNYTRVTGCLTRQNAAEGIRVADGCFIVGNSSSGGFANSAAIRVVGQHSRIEGNDCANSERGIDVTGLRNIIIRNTCTGNDTDWVFAVGNLCGPIVDLRTSSAPAVNGFSAPSTLSSTEPNANFSY